MKRMLTVSLAIVAMLALSNNAFALVEKQPVIDKNSSIEYQNSKIIL